MCFDYLDTYATDNNIECRMAWKIFSINPYSHKLQSAFHPSITNCEGLFYYKDVIIEYQERNVNTCGIYSLEDFDDANMMRYSDDWSLCQHREFIILPVVIWGDIRSGIMCGRKNHVGFCSRYIYIPSSVIWMG
jgi:hypothetical protein